MEHILAVGKVTDAAKELIERTNGRVWHVSEVPSVILVQLHDPRFEHEHYENYVIRIKLESGSLIWQGDYDGPEITSVERTQLYSEQGEPVELDTSELDAFEPMDIDDHPF